jgi:hypothetical protein
MADEVAAIDVASTRSRSLVLVAVLMGRRQVVPAFDMRMGGTGSVGRDGVMRMAGSMGDRADGRGADQHKGDCG